MVVGEATTAATFTVPKQNLSDPGNQTEKQVLPGTMGPYSPLGPSSVCQAHQAGEVGGGSVKELQDMEQDGSERMAKGCVRLVIFVPPAHGTVPSMDQWRKQFILVHRAF